METGHWDCKGLVVVGRGHIWDIVVESNLGCTTADMGIRPKSVVVTGGVCMGVVDWGVLEDELDSVELWLRTGGLEYSMTVLVVSVEEVEINISFVGT